MGKSYKQYILQKKATGKKPSSIRKYHYAPLNNSAAIRLLRLKPAPDDSWPIRCSLFHTTLESAPPYIALSYAWGEMTGSQFVNIDSDYIFVTPNLKHALHRLRMLGKGEELILWIDALCIDQENIPERNHQTAHMRAIYEQAASVAVWLGLEYKNSQGAVNLARDLNACASREEVVGIVMNPERVEDLLALVRLFRRQYWWRIWVIQEVSSARKVTIFCGKEAIPWEDFDRVCDIFKEVEEELSSLFYNRLSYARTLTHGGPRGLQLSRFSPKLSAPPLFELLLSHKSKHSTEPKDKVYALVGVSSSREEFGAIDYNLSERHIFTHTARHIISTTKKLDVIFVRQHDENQYNLPSWVPDWTRPSLTSGSLVIGLHHHEPEFRAAGDTMADVRFSSDGYVLHVTGMILGTIEVLGMPYRKLGAPSDVGPSLEAFHDWWNLFTGKHSSLLSSPAVFVRSISCGNWDFEDEKMFTDKLDAIFSLGEGELSRSDMLSVDPPSRSSTLSNSVSSMIDEELFDMDDGEKTQLSTMLNAGLTMNRRRLFLSSEGTVGLAPWDAVEGDVICVLLGCRFPVVLRAVEGHYVVVGEAYVDGFMNGEAMVGLQEKKFVLDNFDIY